MDSRFNKFINKLKQEGYGKIRIVEYIRSVETQKRYYGYGRNVAQLLITKKYTLAEAKQLAKPKMCKITWTLNSKHLTGKAIDINISVYSKSEWNRIIAIGKSCGLNSLVHIGDYGHFELP